MPTATRSRPSTTCTTTSPCSFQVTEYLPIITAGVSKCPVVGTQAPTCLYLPNPSKLLVNVLSCRQQPEPELPAPTRPALGTQPIFIYNVFDTDHPGLVAT